MYVIVGIIYILNFIDKTLTIYTKSQYCFLEKWTSCCDSKLTRIKF